MPNARTKAMKPRRKRRNPQPEVATSSLKDAAVKTTLAYLQDGLRGAVGDIGKAASGYVREQAVGAAREGGRRLMQMASMPGANAEDWERAEGGLPKWASDLLKAPYSVHFIVGGRGEGKSALGLSLAEMRGRETFMLDGPPAFEQYGVTPIKSLGEAKSIPVGSSLFIADAGRYLAARRAMSRENVEFVSDLMELRHMEITFLIDSQFASLVDTFMIPNVIWHKWPELEWEEKERPRYKKIAERAIAAYKHNGLVDDDARKSHVLLYKDETHAGLIKYSPPVWYTPELSKFRGNQGAVSAPKSNGHATTAKADAPSRTEAREPEVTFEGGLPKL